MGCSKSKIIGVLERWNDGVMRRIYLTTLHYSNTPRFKC